jgi:hypothetical protein
MGVGVGGATAAVLVAVAVAVMVVVVAGALMVAFSNYLFDQSMLIPVVQYND